MFFKKITKMDSHFYFSVISGTLLTVSEVLPFVKSVQSNGILDLCTNLSKYLANLYMNTYLLLIGLLILFLLYIFFMRKTEEHFENIIEVVKDTKGSRIIQK